MSKFVTLDEAAKQLGMTPEAVNELRQRGDLYGYRDGTSWKFKPEDIERIAQRGTDAPLEESQEIFMGDSQEISEAPMDLPIDPDEDDSTDDVVLLSEFELGESGPSASATVIGRPGQPLSSFDSDVKLAASADEDAGTSRTILGMPGAPAGPGESVVKLDTPRPPSAGESSTSVTMVGVPGQPLDPDDSVVRLQTGSAGTDSPSSTLIGRPGQQPGESVIKLSTFEDEFDVGVIPPPPVTGGSAVRLPEPPAPDPVVDSGITLGHEFSDDDFVLGGPGSDITISPGDSGISLVDPSDSGLSLDAPIELKSAAAEANFEVSESGEDLAASGEFDSDEVMELKTSDEFLLTPMAAEGEESSDDSGSQVIALESESPFEGSDSSMFASAEGSMATMLEEDVGGGIGGLGEASLGGGPAPAFASAAAGPVAAYAPEATYPAWVVVLLFFCILFMALCGMMMYDLVRNMWSWNGPYKVNSAIMDTILGLFGQK